MRPLLQRLSVSRIVVLVFLSFISLGSIAIYISEGGNLSYVDAFYLAASSVCVTGLSPIPISELSYLTQWILMICIQMGGLGIITFTVFAGILIVKGESRNTSFNKIVKEMIDATEEKEIVYKYNSREVLRILFSVINISLTFEAIGALLIYATYPPELPHGINRWFFSFFTSISAFNNAGFSIVDDLSLISTDPISIYVTSFLVILGGIGFPVIIYTEKIILRTLQKIFYEIESRLETDFFNKIIMNPQRKDLPAFYEFFIKCSHYLDQKIDSYNSHLHGESNRIQYKILFRGTLFLLLFGTISVLLLEQGNEDTLAGMTWDKKIANSFFISVCSRTAGFTTIDFTGIRDATVVIVTVLMFIGGGPQGTAGGVKITTFAVLWAYFKNVIQPMDWVKIFGEKISKNSVAISIRLYFLATITLAVLFLILTIMNERGSSLFVIFFELASAFATVGYSLGLTPLLSDAEKILYSIIMLAGRIGLFTILIAITGRSLSPEDLRDDDGIKIQVG